MSTDKFNPRTIALIIFIMVTGAIRTYLSIDENMFGLSNFSPLGAMAIFGGAYFNKKWKAILFPLLTLFISDVTLHFTVFNNGSNGLLYGGWYYVYGTFTLMVIVGWHIRKIKMQNVVLASIVIALIHWLVTDFGVWLNSTKYPQTLLGYWQCLLVAIPFELRFFTGTLIYSAVLFGLFERLQRRYRSLANEK